MPIITEKEMKKVKMKQGLYATISERNSLNKTVTGIVKRSFTEYARKHGCTESMVEVEWERFNRIFQSHLYGR